MMTCPEKAEIACFGIMPRGNSLIFSLFGGCLETVVKQSKSSAGLESWLYFLGLKSV